MMPYKVELNIEALKDVDTLSDWLRDNLSPAGARRYLDAMISEIRTLSVYADFFRPSRYMDIRAIHPQARHMVSHNKKWVFVFHIEEDMVVVDRILPAKLIKR